MTDSIKQVHSIEELFYEIPLYEMVKLQSLAQKAQIIGSEKAVFEGFCPQCRKEQPFYLDRDFIIHRKGDVPVSQIVEEKVYKGKERTAYCTRDHSHELRILFDIKGTTLVKIGQLPSLADLGNSEIKRFRGTLAKQDLNELHKAIGLAAHGVGVGSFVYFRRIFERLIQSRFDEFKEIEGWDIDAFRSARMEEKVSIVRNHIPDLLYENRSIYGILSKGIHELNEEECLSAFPILKKSIIFILDDDLRKKEEIRQRAELSAALRQFT